MITVQQAPQLITTLNLALFKVVSDRPSIIQFKVAILDAATGFVLTVQKYATVPMILRGTTFDLANILSAFVEPQIANSFNVLELTPRIIRGYRLQITEIYIDGNGNQADGDIYDSPVYQILNAELSRIDFRGFDYRTLLAGSGVQSKFLSVRPNNSSVFLGDKEFVYLLTSVDCIARVFYYRPNGTVLAARDTYISGDALAYRLDLSPIYGVYENSNPFTSQFTPPFGIGGGGADVALYYSLVLLDMGMNPISETKIYNLVKSKCNIDRRQIFFSNNLGGLDSFSFTQPKQSVTSIKTEISANMYQYDANGNYTDFNNGVYNPEKVTIASAKQNTFSLISDPLTDRTALYARSLIESENVFFKLADNTFLPITLEQQDYDITKRKITTANERLTIRFKINDTYLNI